MLTRQAKISMGLVGALGFGFFIIANFSDFSKNYTVTAGLIQVCINILVFVVWGREIKNATGKAKFICVVGTAVPAILGTVTILRVLVPAIVQGH
jgi:hypothetical protein